LWQCFVREIPLFTDKYFPATRINLRILNGREVQGKRADAFAADAAVLIW
jgi:hypothetical protein